MLIQKQVTVGDFQAHCYLFACTETGDALLLDPGDEAPRIESMFSELAKQLRSSYGRELKLKMIAHTHAHLDHMGATRAIRDSLMGKDAQILIHRKDEELYYQLNAQGTLFGRRYSDPLPLDGYLSEGEPVLLGKQNFSVLHTPGHSPGSVCLLVGGLLFSGDTIFQGSVGRTDLWNGDPMELEQSLRCKILPLADEVRIFPGHGPETRVGIEKRSNPFCRLR